ncbi:hypothetical protein [Staphylococcus lutrae]|uniref:Uncharacterized protein n=1 Tax=Staphylococcus lutrae TaxID=155085 RepID=A0AAC9WJX2_9STAP|nr:hypothetical protein [Staphylococcus lutrae]ARJ51301.1 hypothetical protein B5P37_08255 [Staphylococcus lutrae]PNZ37244.1 hypothetical protein CD134_06720 [Staphylococcus lutrae]
MSKSNEQPEVIDPSDPRYKRLDDFSNRHDPTFQNSNGHYTNIRYFGCAPVGCLPGCLFSILLSILLTLLLNWLF